MKIEIKTKKRGKVRNTYIKQIFFGKEKFSLGMVCLCLVLLILN